MGAGKAARTAVASPRRVPVSIGEAGRTREKVLRIVFQPYIDERGRLHEASAVHAVVAQGEWQQQAIADASGLSSRNDRAAAYAGETLADAVDRAETERSPPPKACLTRRLSLPRGHVRRQIRLPASRAMLRPGFRQGPMRGRGARSRRRPRNPSAPRPVRRTGRSSSAAAAPPRARSHPSRRLRQSLALLPRRPLARKRWHG
jgi:conjugal transfer pilus assembly protein TraV